MSGADALLVECCRLLSPKSLARPTAAPPDRCCASPTSRLFAASVSASGDGLERMALTPSGCIRGTTLLQNDAYAHVLQSSLLDSRCSTCFRQAQQQALLLCQQCKLVRYCDKACSARDWKSGHRHECKHLPSIFSELKGREAHLDELRLLVRTLSTKRTGATECTATATATAPDVKEAISCGTTHFNEMSQAAGVSEFGEDPQEGEATLGVLMRATIILQQAGVSTSLEETGRGLARFRTNNFGILDELFTFTGHGVYPAAALLQHSCSPTCLLTYKSCPGQPPTLHAIALSDLEPGAELTHSYVDLCKPYRQRRNDLQQSHNFTCTCTRCQEQSKVFTGDADFSHVTAKELAYTASLDSNDPLALRAKLAVMEAHTDRPHALVELMVGGDMHASSATLLAGGQFGYDRYRTTCRAFEAALSQGRIDESVRLCRQIVSFLHLSLRHVSIHPLVGLQLFTLGDLCAMLAKDDNSENYTSLTSEARGYYAWCKEILEVTHSASVSSSDLLQRLREALRELGECDLE